ncbi:MAG TPA: DoxX family protein [Chitinophagaceae bacterium]|nr:DoxX family protein [Chitinophagaceae bacterium]
MKKIFQTNESNTSTIIRVVLGIILFPHGAQKMLGWFGGYGFNGTMGFLTGTAGLPWIIAFLVIAIEFFGAIALIVGFATRIVAAGIISLFTGIIVTSHLHNGFFMNWYGNLKGEGYEFHLLIIGIAIALLVSGAGKWSVDYALQKKK